jgi:hypothetical protein
MPRGSGNYSVARITGDDKVQLWGKWHYQGTCVGVYQGLYAMDMEYGPYKPLFLVAHGASVLFEQCEVRNFGGKCIVARYFSEVLLDWCTVGGSCGWRAGEHHRKLQVWRRELLPMVLKREAERQVRRARPGSFAGRRPAAEEDGVDLRRLWAPAGSRRASDGVSVESGAWLVGRRVCFEDTGRANGVAVRAVGHARVDLDTCRFRRNRVHLAADATAVMHLEHCHEMVEPAARPGAPPAAAPPRATKVPFHVRRALQLPGNGTSVLEAQEPTRTGELAWRVPNATNRNWQFNSRPHDPTLQRKRAEQRAERAAIRARIRAAHPDGVRGARKRVHATHRDFTPFTAPPRTRTARRVAASERLRRERDLAALAAPETLADGPPVLVRRVDPAAADADPVGTAAAAAAEAAAEAAGGAGRLPKPRRGGPGGGG